MATAKYCSGTSEHTLPTVVTAVHDSLAVRLASLNAGADDYLPKPFSLSAPGAIVPGMGPKLAGLGSTSYRIGHRCRRLIG